MRTEAQLRKEAKTLNEHFGACYSVMAQIVQENSDFHSEDGVHIYTILQALSVLIENTLYSLEVVGKNLSLTGEK